MSILRVGMYMTPCDKDHSVFYFLNNMLRLLPLLCSLSEHFVAFLSFSDYVAIWLKKGNSLST